MSSSIKAIDRESIRKICSGQVVVDLATAVKELVENSLDAGATTIEIKLRDMGLGTIEVNDNGCGIDPANYASLALKHYTSKLTTFDDLQSVSSFGFRGEALNALCELSGSLTITTRKSDESVGTKLSFSSQLGGTLIGQAIIPRGVGTSVIVEELFGRLPVRRSEFQRSIKKQYQKLVRVLQSYAIIATGVRLILINSQEDGPGKSKVSTVIASQGSAHVGDNIAAIFGNKFLQTLVAVDCSMELPTLGNDGCEQELNSDVDGESGASMGISECLSSALATEGSTSLQNKIVRVKGYVSKVGEGVGRSDNDRQFLYCNGRPVDLPKITKLVNEVWRKYEMKHKSACVLDVLVPPGCYDVNLSPDKREVVISGEHEVMDMLRERLDAIFAPSQSTFLLAQGNQRGAATMGVAANSTGTNTQVQTSLFDMYNRLPCEPAASASSVEKSSIPPQDEACEPEESKGSNATEQYGQSPEIPLKRKRDADASSTVWLSPAEEHLLRQYQEQRTTPGHNQPSYLPKELMSEHKQTAAVISLEDLNDDSASTLGNPQSSPTKTISLQLPPQQRVISLSPRRVEENMSERKLVILSETKEATLHEPSTQGTLATAKAIEDTTVQPLPWVFDITLALESIKKNSNFTRNCDPDLKRTRRDNHEIETVGRGKPDMTVIGSEVEIATAVAVCDMAADDAERSLARVLHKDDFARMRVIGQFNLGFIICELRGDLFLLDQHACDEKFRFERLQLHTEVHRQPLFRPLPLQCSAAEEMLIIDHMHVFERNGFRFVPLNDEHTKSEDDYASIGSARNDMLLEAPRVGSRLHLSAMPFSKSTKFDVNDVHELASLLAQDSRLGSDCYLGDSNMCNTGGGGGGGVDVSKLMHKNQPLLRKSLVSSTAEDTMVEERVVDNIPVLPKLMQMFASRACRSAVMIGTALSTPQMRKIVGQMKEVLHPWQCPHGRPTMRHMVDLSALPTRRMCSTPGET